MELRKARLLLFLAVCILGTISFTRLNHMHVPAPEHLTVSPQSACGDPRSVSRDLPENDAFAITSFIAALSAQPSSLPLPTSRSLLTIPVIVHIIYDPLLPPDADPYPDDDRIRDGIDWINHLLAGGPACPGDPLSVDTRIRLCLATRDITGAPASGINRFAHALTDTDLCRDDPQLKAIPRITSDPFPHTDYLNLYIVRDICASCMPEGCLAGGYAAFPDAHGTSHDGIVLEADTWMHPYCHYRKVILHEIGHYLNLLHTWQGGDCANLDCTTDGDGVCDTPPDADINIYPSNPCLEGLPVNSCTSDVNLADPFNPFTTDQPDMTSNLMDYAPPACIAVFTPGQADRMAEALQGPRASLLTSPGCDPPCHQPVTFDIAWPDTPILYGAQIQITHASTGAPSYLWTVNGAGQGSGTLLFDAPATGLYEICLIAEGLTAACHATQCHILEVACAVPLPEIALSDHQTDPGQTVILSHISPPQPGYTYTWYVNGAPIGSGASMPFVPDIQGSYTIWLEACTPSCCASSDHAWLAAGTCPSGKEAHHWLFGRDSIYLDWNSGAPVQQAPSGCRSDETMAVAVHPSGQLLFYSNSERVYNRLHQQMPNGFLINGNRSATHALTVPMPGSDSLWYLFYPEMIILGNPGLDTTRRFYMAIIDMSLAGGLGDVIHRNEILMTPTTEKVAATRHCNGTDWWILGHEAGSNRFFAWLLSRDGLSPPVISASGIAKSKHRYTKVGEMNFSPDGLRIAMSTGPDGLLEPVPVSTIELFDFDPATGKVSGDFILDHFPLGNGSSAYGLEFSPSSQSLFVTYFHPLDTIYRYDLRDPDPQTIRMSRSAIYGATVPLLDQVGAMLTGPDGRIHVAQLGMPYLGTIHHPDSPGAAFVSQGIMLQRGESFLGLPTFPAGIYTPGKPWLKGPAILCDTLAEALCYIAANCRYQDYQWHIDGPAQILRTQGDSVWIRPLMAGDARLIVSKTSACGITADTLRLRIDPCLTPSTPCRISTTLSAADTLICQGEDAWIRFYTDAPIVRYTRDSDGITRSLTSPVLVIPTPHQNDIITLYLAMPDGCDTSFRIGIHLRPPIQASILRADSVVCHGQPAILHIQHDPGMLVEIIPPDASWVITNPAWPLLFGPPDRDTLIYVRMRDLQMSCDSFFPWPIRVPLSVPHTFDTLTLCAGDSIFLHDQWRYPGDTLTTIYAGQGCDSVLHTFIRPLPPLTPLISIQGPCTSDDGAISVTMTGGTPPFTFSLNGGPPQDLPIFEMLPAGHFDLAITDAHGCRLDTTLTLVIGTGIGGLSAQIIHPACGRDDGVITLHASQTGIHYQIGPGPPSPDSVFAGLAEGLWQIIATHPLGCVDTFSTRLVQTGQPHITGLATSPALCDRSDGTITLLHIEGGTAPYTIQLAGMAPDTSTHFGGLSAGVYTITLIDDRLCATDTTIIIGHLPPPLIRGILISPALCGQPQGALVIETGTASSLTYQLDEGTPTTDPFFDHLAPGIYLLTLTDTSGCTASMQVTIPDSFSFVLGSIHITPARCGDATGSLTVITSPESTAISITLAEKPGETFDAAIEGLSPGTYTLRIRDEQMCILDTIIRIPSVCEIYLPNVFSPNADGINDGFGQVTVSSFDLWELTVFDRSGNMIFQSRDPLTPWDGRYQGRYVQSGVYAWTLRYQVSGDVQARYSTGDVTVVR